MLTNVFFNIHTSNCLGIISNYFPCTYCNQSRLIPYLEQVMNIPVFSNDANTRLPFYIYTVNLVDVFFTDSVLFGLSIEAMFSGIFFSFGTGYTCLVACIKQTSYCKWSMYVLCFFMLFTLQPNFALSQKIVTCTFQHRTWSLLVSIQPQC